MDITFYDITVYLGILGLLMMIFSYLTGMRIWKSKKRMIHLPGMYNGSIVWDHFVKKKKAFSEIIGPK